MAIITQNHALNIVPGVSVPVVVHVSQGDTGVQLEFTLLNGSTVFDPTGKAVSAHGIREDGAGWGPVECTKVNGKIRFALPAAATALKGSGMAEVTIADSSGIVGTTNFAILVENATFPNGVTYSNDVSVYEQILAYTQSAYGSLNARIDQIVAPSGEAPNPAEITDARIGFNNVTYPNLGTAIRTQIGSLNQALGNKANINWKVNAFINSVTGREGTDSTLCCTDFIDIINAEKISVWMTTGAGTEGLVFYDSNKVYLSGNNYPSTQMTHYFLDVPANAKYVRYTTKKADYTNSELYIVIPTKKILETVNDVENLSNSLDESFRNDSVYNYDIVQGLDVTNTTSVIPSDVFSNWDYANAWLEANGVEHPDTSEISTRLLQCYPNEKYLYRGKLTYSPSICFYDINKRFISGKSGHGFGDVSDNIEFTTPSNCYYIRATCDKSTIINNQFHIYYRGSLKTSKRETGEYSLLAESQIAKLGANVLSNTVQALEFTHTFGDTIYLRLNVTIPKNVHDVEKTLNIVRLTGASHNINVELKKSKPTIRNTNPLYPLPVYNASIRSNYDGQNCTDYGMTDTFGNVTPNGTSRILLVGKDTMSIRFTGDCTDVNNQDLMFGVTSTSFKIYHSTGGSVVKEYLKSDYSTMRDFYLAIESDINNNVLTDYEVEWFNLDSYVPSDIIECDVHLVAPYQRSSGGAYNAYDAFPFYFAAKEEPTEYTIEIVIRKKASYYTRNQMIVNGYGVHMTAERDASYYTDFFNKTVNVTIGDTDSDNDVIVKSIMISDAEDYAFPNTRILYAERYTTGLKTHSWLTTSPDGLSVLANHMNNDEGFSYATLNDLLNYVRGNTMPTKKKLWHFSHDDSCWDAITDRKALETYLINDVLPSFGVFMHRDLLESNVAKAKTLIPIGYYWMIHSVYGTEAEGAPSIGLFNYADMKRLIDATLDKFEEVFGYQPIAWDFHGTDETYNQIAYLKNHGIELIFSSSGKGLITPINRYACDRTQYSDAMSEDLSGYPQIYDSYLNQG